MINDLRRLAKQDRKAETLSSTDIARSTQEQLRIDHIQTLEVLQNAVNEIARLKLEMKGLQQKGSSSASEDDVHGDCSSMENKNTDLDVDAITARVLDQEAEIRKLKNKLCATELNMQEQQERLEAQLGREIEKRKEVRGKGK